MIFLGQANLTAMFYFAQLDLFFISMNQLHSLPLMLPAARPWSCGER